MPQYTTFVIPAIQQILTYMAAVAADDLPDLNIGVYCGMQTEATQSYLNTLSIGSWSEGGSPIVTGFNSTWRGLAGGTSVNIDRNNPFSIHWSVVAFAGSDGGDPATSPALVNAGAMFDAMVNRILSDPSGSGSLGGSCYWDTINMTFPLYGPVAPGGVQAVMECVVGVRGASIGTGS